jgi:hypothetical protein
MKKLSYLLLIAAVACSPSKKQEESGEAQDSENMENTTDQAPAESGIKFTKAPDSPQYPEATLTRTSVTSSQQESGNE